MYMHMYIDKSNQFYPPSYLPPPIIFSFLPSHPCYNTFRSRPILFAPLLEISRPERSIEYKFLVVSCSRPTPRKRIYVYTIPCLGRSLCKYSPRRKHSPDGTLRHWPSDGWALWSLGDDRSRALLLILVLILPLLPELLPSRRHGVVSCDAQASASALSIFSRQDRIRCGFEKLCIYVYEDTWSLLTLRLPHPILLMVLVLLMFLLPFTPRSSTFLLSSNLE